MKIDEYGYVGRTEQELCTLLRQNPNINLDHVPLQDAQQHLQALDDLYLDLPKPIDYDYLDRSLPLEEYHRQLQQQWQMPEEYQQLDIARWLLEQCSGDVELQRMGRELLLFQDRNLMVLLQYLKYLVDTLQKNSVVMGVGRGSSVASFALYKIGVHRINSIEYDLPIEEFLR